MIKVKIKQSKFFSLILLLLILFTWGAHSISNKVLYPVASNMGLKTDYYMSFNSDLSYSLPDLNIKIEIPIEYQISQIQQNLECYTSDNGMPNSYVKMGITQCYIVPNLNTSYSITGQIIVKKKIISSTTPIHLVFRNIRNPSVQSSSFFAVCIRSSQHLLQCDKQFKMVSLTPGFKTTTNSISIKSMPIVSIVGQGTTYYFKIATQIPSTLFGYDINNQNAQIRVILPSLFRSSNPICSLLQYNKITGTYNTIQTITSISPSREYIIECNKIQRLINDYVFYNSSTGLYELEFKVQNIQNPFYSDSFNGIYVQISRGGRNQIVQRIQFSQAIIVNAQQIQGSVKQTNMMRNATNEYFFSLTHDFPYSQRSKIRITIGNNTFWKINDVKLMFGFENPKNSTILIKNSISSSTAEISNYGLASNQVQQFIAINLTSSSTIGDHIVKIQTFIDDRISGIWQGTVYVNSTWGSFNRLSFSAVQQPVKLPVNKTGPLQFKLFLNYQLPQSQNIQNGSMIITFTPPIATPDPDIYGKVKCYFKATMQAAQCIYDNSDPTKTKVTIVSPPYDQFQYSEIPIIITTEGGIDEDHLGLTISPIVQRYKFDVYFYLYNSSTIASQILFTNWVADAIDLADKITAKSLSWQCNQWTSLHIKLITPLLDSPTSRQQRFVIQFLNEQKSNFSAWALGLGYEVDKLYKEFPCVIVGLVGVGIKCDLYTYVSNIGPYNKQHVRSRYFGPFIMVYSFQQPVTTSSNVDIYLPGIKLSNNVGVKARVSFSILQQTPGQTQPYIQLYQKYLDVFTSKLAPSIIPIEKNSLMPQVQVQTPNIYTISWNPVNNPNVAFIKYDFSPIKNIPSLDTKFNTCTGSVCYSSGHPNNWLVQIPNSGLAGSVSTSHTLTTSTNILSMPYIDKLLDPYPVKITTYDANGNTLEIINMINNYVPQPMTGSFNLLASDMTIYAGLKQWYSIEFDSPIGTTSTYPFIRFKLNNDLKFSRPQQCQSTTILAFNESGIKCNIVSGTSDSQIIVWNIQTIASSLTYEIKFRLQTKLADYSTIITPTVDVYLNHNQTLVDSLVGEVRLIALGQPQIPQKAKPQQFSIHNPQILNEQIRINYIGRLFIDFESSTGITTNFKIKFPNHRYNLGIWKTPNGLDTDPVVCMLNGKRFYCDPKYATQLSILIYSAHITAGKNRLEIDTQYIAPYNGLVFPNYAGNYQIQMSTIANLKSMVEVLQHTFYVYIHPLPLEDLQIASIVRDINTESVYVVNFTIADPLIIPNFNHFVGNYSRIFIQFPTVVDGQRIFEDNLGGYKGELNQRVGCAFKKGPNYVVAQATKLLECRLIPPQIPGAPVKVQVINFDIFSSAIDSLGVFIFKVRNPAIAINSVQIKVKINQYTPNGYVYPLYESDYIFFLDPQSQNLSPINHPSSQSQLSTFFDVALDVGHYGTASIKAQTINPTATLPFYMLVKMPSYLPVQNEQISPAFANCPPANFQYCLTAPDVNYILVRAITNASFFDVYIKNYPLGISQDDSYFYSMIIEEGRYAGNIQYIISQQKRWPDILGSLTYNFIDAVGLVEKTVKQKQKMQILISFNVTNYIPQTGTIQISFPSSITKIYPYCRSAISNGSLLYSKAGLSGQIGCDVQNVNKWVITGFEQVLPASLILISGYIDLPTVAGPLGLGEIITYADNHPTDIYSNGSRIDYANPYFALDVQNNLAMNPNQDVFLTQRDVIRVGDIGEFRLLFKFASSLTTTGHIKLHFSKFDHQGNAGGFVLTLAEKKVCQFIDISNENRIGCEVVLQQQLPLESPKFVVMALRTFEDLDITKTYELRLTTQKYSYPATPEGIRYPTVSSNYKIEVETKYSFSSSSSTVQHLYLQVFGTQFKTLKVTQHNYIQNQYNLYWFEIQPTNTIATTDQIIIEFPTKSNDGVTNLFTFNLGLYEYQNGNLVATDIFDSTIDGAIRDNTFMKCNIFHGDIVTGMPVKIVCGSFLFSIDAGQTLRFALGIVNPPVVNSQLSIPLTIYSVNPFNFQKTNYNLVTGAGYIYDKSSILAKAGYTTTSSQQLQMPFDDLKIGDAHTFDLLAGDSFILKLGFPLRVNDKVPGGCKDASNTTIYGDAYYHQRLRVIVCKLTATLVAQITPVSATLLINSFYTPWYYLAPVQQKIYAIAHYYSTTTSQVVLYTDPFPLLPPRYVFSASLISTLTLTPIINHNTQCQRQDYVFTIQLDSGGAANFNLQYTRLIGIVFPLQATVDFVTFGRDCVEHPNSQIEVRLCEINNISRTIYIQIVPGLYSNDKIIAIQTKGLALRNPCLVPAPNVNQFVVNFFSWQNITVSDKRANNRVYMTMDSRNMAPLAFNYIVQASNLANTYFYPFEWIQMPHERYFNEFLQYKSNQYSPFKFDIIFAPGIIGNKSLGCYNTLTLFYGNEFDTFAVQDQYIKDLKYNTQLCYLRNTRVSNCIHDNVNKKITMFFEFQLPPGEWINVYFSVQDPRNLELNGFKYIGTDFDIANSVYLQLKQYNVATSQIYKVPPFEAKQTNLNPPTAVLPERAIINGEINYATQLTSQLNVIDMIFTINPLITDIRGLKFEIPLVDEFGAEIFSNPGPAFMDLEDGDQYPCGNNDPFNANTGRAKCYLIKGQGLPLGQPTIIIMTDFKYTTQIKARLLIRNPTTPNVWFTIVAKAYKGTTGGQTSLIGHRYVGYWRFYNVFKTIDSTLGGLTQATVTSSSTYLYPANPLFGAPYTTLNPLWMDNTNWMITGIPAIGGGAAVGQYVIFEGYLNDYDVGYTQPQFCQADWVDGNTNSDDMIIYKYRPGKQERVFFIKTWAASPWAMQYYKCRHYLKPVNVYYHTTKAVQAISTYYIPFSSYVYLSHTLSTIRYHQVMKTKQFIEVDITSAMTQAVARGLNWQNQINYILLFTLSGAISFQSISGCQVVGGFANYQGGIVSCIPMSVWQFRIENFNEIIKNQLNQYKIKIDIDVAMTVTLGPSSTTVLLQMYAGRDAYNNLQDMLYINSAIDASRVMPQWTPVNVISYGSGQHWNINLESNTGVTWTATSQSYLSNPQTLDVKLTSITLTTTQLIFTAQVDPISGVGYGCCQITTTIFRFMFEGISFVCSGLGSFSGIIGNTWRNLAAGFTCGGQNYFYYDTRQHSLSDWVIRQFSSLYPVGTNTWGSGDKITFNGVISVASVKDVSTTRPWIGLKVFMHSSVYDHYDTTYPCDCCTCWTVYWYNVIGYNLGYGQDYYVREDLFSSVSLSALSNLVNYQTELQITMNYAQIAFGPSINDKVLLLQFNTNQIMFPYINNTGVIRNHLIQCICMTSSSSTFAPSVTTTYTDRECYLKLTQGTYSITAISVNLDIPIYNYAKCYFPGFVLNTPHKLIVTAKYVDQGTNLANWPLGPTRYSSLLFTNSPDFEFFSGSIPNSAAVTESPTLYDGSYVSKIKTSFSGGYTLNVALNFPMSNPIFYVNFQKAGPIPDSNLCSNTATYSVCRIYFKYRNIMVAQYAYSVSAGTFYSATAKMPNQKQPDLGSDYSLIVYAKQSWQSQYMHNSIFPRVSSNLLPTNTTMTVFPDRITSLDYNPFRANLILSFKLETHQLVSLYQKNAFIEISFTPGTAYFSSSKSCMVTTYDINEDLKFSFYCQLDVPNNKIIIQNRYYKTPFTANGLIQVVVGVTNQPYPITFYLKMYKWYVSANDYGLLIDNTEATYTPYVVPATQNLLTMNYIKHYPFYTRVYSDSFAPWRITFKFPTTMTTPLDILNNATSFMILDDFDQMVGFTTFQCYIKQFSDLPAQNQPPHPNAYRNYKQNTQYYFIPTYCGTINTTALRIQIPRNRILDNTKYYQLVVLPVAATNTGFTNANDVLAKLVVFPAPNSEHIFQTKIWTKNAFDLSSFWIVTTRPQQPTAIQIFFSPMFASALDFPNHYIQIVFNNLDFGAINPPYNQMGQTVPCSLSSTFSVSADGIQKPNCIVSYADQKHQVIKIRVQNNNAFSASSLLVLSLDYFFLPIISGLLQQTSPFTICIHYYNYPNIAFTHQKCFGEMFMIDGYTNTNLIVYPVDALFNDPSQLRHGEAVTPFISFSYPVSSTSQRHQKLMIRIKGGYSATRPAPMSFSGSSLIWYNQLIGMYIHRQDPISISTNHVIQIPSKNPYPYQMEQYMLGNNVELTYYANYHPHTRYTVTQTLYPKFILHTPLVKIGLAFSKDIRGTIKSGTQSTVQISIDITQIYSLLTLHQNDRFQLQFTSNVAKVNRCWITTKDSPIPYSLTTICTPKPSVSNRIQILNFFASNTNHNLTIYAVLEITGTPIGIKSYLYAVNDQIQFISTANPSINSVSSLMTGYSYLSFTQSYYIKGYYQQMIKPITHTFNNVRSLYLSLFLPQNLIQANSIFTIFFNATTQSIKPMNFTFNTRLVCEWMRVDNYGRKYGTGKYTTCTYVAPNIVINAPLWNLPTYDASGNRIPYLLKIRQEAVTTTQFLFSVSSQVEQIILVLDNNGIQKKDTLKIHPYQHFTGLRTKHTTLTTSQLNTYHIEFTTPMYSILAGGYQYVLTLELDSKYLDDTLGIKDIYTLYGQDSANSSIVDNLGLNMVYTSLPNKWVNGAPYSCFTSIFSPAQHTCISKSSSTIRINLLVEPDATYNGNLVWKIPLLKNPSTEKPLRQNITLWSYPAASPQGNKELFYQIINEFVTKVSPAPSNISYDISAVAIAANKIQTTTNSLNVQFPTYVPTADSVIQMKLLPRTTGLIDIPSMWTNTYADTTSYSFFFFKNINFLIAQKLVSDNSQLINIGSVQISNQFSDEYGYQWLKVHSKASIQTVKTSSKLVRNIPECTVPSITFTLMSGSNLVRDSKFEGKFTFTTPCNIPLNSTLQLRGGITDVQFLGNNDEIYCETTFRSTDCWIDATTKYLNIRIDQLIPLNTLIEITTFLKSKSRTSIKSISAVVYAIPNKKSTLVNSIGASPVLPVTDDLNIITKSKVFPLIIKPLYENQYNKLSGTFTTGHLPFNYLNIKSPFSKVLTSNQTFYYQQNSTIGSQYNIYESKFNNNWIKTFSTVATNYEFTQTILPNGVNSYAIQTSKSYWFNIGSMYETSADLNNFFIGPVGSFYQFQYNTDIQIAYHEVYPVPIAEPLTLFNPLTQVGEETVLGIEFFCLYQNIQPLDIIQIQLDSFNLIQDMYKFTNDAIECIEFIRGVLTNNIELVCEVIQYPDAINNIPMKIYVYPTNPVAANVTVNIWLSPVINSPNVLVAGVTVRLLRPCNGQKLCEIYQGRGFHRTTNTMAVNSYDVGVATFAATPNVVLQVNSQHSFTFNSINLQTAFIKYPQIYQGIMALTCTSVNTCLVFPKQRKIVTYQPTPAFTTSFLINGLVNGIYVLPQNMIDLKLSSPSNLDKYIVDHGYLLTRQYMPALGYAPNTFTITNMQGPGTIFLRNFWNVVKMQITGLFTSQFIKAFYIKAPVQVTQWDSTYCNATIAAPLHNPYPTRLQCMTINKTTIQIKISQGVNYQPTVSQTQVLTILAKFWLTEFPLGMDILYVSPPILSGNFYAYGSHMLENTASTYFITQTFTNITISQHKTPFIGQAAFNTQSFQERLASINDKTTFDILIDPITTQPIDYIEVVIPEQFKYPNVQNHDMCKLIFRRTTDLTSCRQTRKDNQTIITMDIDQSTYDNGPRILQIASKNMTDWFTAPSIPGSLYNMTISLYGVNGTLLEKQSTKNSSRIKGYDIKLASIVVNNGHDQLQNQIYDISFLVGVDGIKQGYKGILSKGQYYSEIRLKFETVQGYQYLLGGYYQDQDVIGCITSLTSINKQVSCVFDKGTNITDEPMIIITGYQQIPPNTTVKISLANIKNLPASLRNTLSIQVKYYRVDNYSSLDEEMKYSFFMYEPTEAITDVSTALNFSAPSSLTISYAGQTIVNQPTVLSIVVTPSKDITDYIVVKFPKFGLRDDYTRFKPYCANCSKLQIFYRADLIRLYPLGGVHAAGSSIIYKITGFPSTEYVIQDPAFTIKFQGYSGLKIVNRKTISLPLTMNGCKMNGGIVSTTSPYSGDTGVNYKIEIQVNTSELNNMNSSKQLNLVVNLPKQSQWFSNSSSCSVVYPLQCILDSVQKRIVIKNILKYNNTNSAIVINTFGLMNPSFILKQTALQFNSSLYEYYPTSNRQNLICLGNFSFIYLPSPPNKCSMSIKVQHLSTTLMNTYSFGIVCQQNIKDLSIVYIMIPREITFNNPVSNTYKCWTTQPSILLDPSCKIVFVNGTFFLKTMSPLRIGSNIIQFQLNVNLNNPLVQNSYLFGSPLELSGNIYSTTNTANLTFYTQSAQPQLNSSISFSIIPQQAGAQAIYLVKVPNQLLNDKIMLNFGQLNIQMDPSTTRISYIQSNQTNSPNLSQLSYFETLQASYKNPLKYSTSTNSDLTQNILVDTSLINNTATSNISGQSQYTYLMISPIVNPSSINPNDLLSIKIYDTINTSYNSYQKLKAQYSTPMSMKIQNPPANIYQTKYKVIDNDISSITEHNVTFTLDRQLFANQNNTQNIQFIISPPSKSSLNYFKTVQICLYYPESSFTPECQSSTIGIQQLSFKPTKSNLAVSVDTPFKLQIRNISNPSNQTFCTLAKATDKDYLNSYFQLKIFINRQLQYQSVYVGMIDDSLKPCVQFKNKKGDILNNLPQVISAGFQTKFNISVTQATSNLRVFIQSNDSDVSFVPSYLYFNNYGIMSQQLKALVQASAVNKTVQIKIVHEQTLGFSTFRYTEPFVVKVISSQKQTVTVNEMQSSSVGYDIKIPIILSKPSVHDMNLIIKPNINSLIEPYMKFFTFSSQQVVIPRLSESSYFTVKYNGTKIPPTLNISLQLTSKNNLVHYLLKDRIYLYFSVDQKFQTLPPIMKMNLMWFYKANQDQISKTVYYCCGNNTQKLNYDQLKPEILQYKVLKLSATKASVKLWTRNPATLYYQLKQKGRNLDLENATSEFLRLSNNSLNALTIRNSTKLVNAQQILNFTNLQHQTQYFLFVGASDAFGDSQKITIVQFKTGSLSNAIKFDMNCLQILTDEVYIVKALADVLQIDMRRIRVVSSQINLLNKFSLSTQNKPVYPHQIVISPSNQDDSLSPMDVFKQRLLNNDTNKALLKEKIPSWLGNFDTLSQYQSRKPFYQLNPFRPQFKAAPTTDRISYYNASISVKFWNKVRVSAIMITQENKTPDYNIDFINKKPVGKKVSSLNSSEQRFAPSSKQIIKGLNFNGDKLEKKYTFTGLTNENGQGTVFFKGLKPGQYCRVYITATNPEEFQPTISLALQSGQVYLIDFNLMWNPNLKGNDHAILQQVKKKNQQMYEAIQQFYSSQQQNKKTGKKA